MATALATTGDYSGADRTSQQAVEICESLVTLDPKNAHYAFSIATVARDRGDVLLKSGQRSGAAEAYRRSRAVIEPLASVDSGSWLKRRLLAEVLSRQSASNFGQ